MEKALINFKIDKNVKEEMEEICNDMGISISTAFNIFAKKLIKRIWKDKKNLFNKWKKQEVQFTRLIMIKSWTDKACSHYKDK